MNLERQFHQNAPTAIYLAPENIDLVNRYLRDKGWISSIENVESLGEAGEGNMNCVLRASTNYRTFILKQSRPWVEKYPQIAAPVERVEVEAEFMNIAGSKSTLSSFIPPIRHFDPENYLIMMDDLGEASDFSDLYQGNQLTIIELEELLHFLKELHSLKLDDFPDNLKMRKLNYEHIFVIPFETENGLDLDSIHPGLANLSDSVTSNPDLRNKVKELGQEYLNIGSTLLHGDYYPGSFLRTDSGIKVIDAEFAFLGFPEFDWAVLLAHLNMAHQPVEIITFLFDSAKSTASLDLNKIRSYAGVEILRRLFGVAQLPLTLSLEDKENLKAKAIKWIQLSD